MCAVCTLGSVPVTFQAALARGRRPEDRPRGLENDGGMAATAAAAAGLCVPFAHPSIDCLSYTLLAFFPMPVYVERMENGRKKGRKKERKVGYGYFLHAGSDEE